MSTCMGLTGMFALGSSRGSEANHMRTPIMVKRRKANGTHKEIFSFIWWTSLNPQTVQQLVVVGHLIVWFLWLQRVLDESTVAAISGKPVHALFPFSSTQYSHSKRSINLSQGRCHSKRWALTSSKEDIADTSSWRNDSL